MINPEQLRLTAPECKRALDRMAGGKSPCVDGFPAKFYKRFRTILADDYVDMINYCFTARRLSATQRSGVITLLHKRGDPLNMKNWCPITLLCMDYKIAAKVLANRLLLVLHFVINPDQSCAVSGAILA